MRRWALRHASSGQLVASTLIAAFDRATRNKGLLGRHELAPGSAMILAPCSSVHTFFMKFIIDVVFVDRNGSVLKGVADLKPWRIAARPGAYAVIELNAGAIRRSELKVGDRLSVRESTLRS